MRSNPICRVAAGLESAVRDALRVRCFVDSRHECEARDFCPERDLAPDVELIELDQINEACERMTKGDVRYRFVIDIASLR